MSDTLSEASFEAHEYPNGIAKTSTTSGQCESCLEIGTRLKCQQCRNTWYCDKQCQKVDWKSHKFHCHLKRPLDSADYLVMDCWENELPSEDLVLQDLGFGHFEDFSSPSKILGLFIGLVKHLDIGDRKLHTWQVQCTLREIIIAEFSKLSEGSRGGYCPWFLQRDWIFDQVSPKADSLERLEAWFRPFRHVLDPEDSDTPVQDLKFQAKRETFVYYSNALK